MKTLTVFLLSTLATANSFAQGKIQVVVQNIQEAKGSIRVGLFDNDDDFLKNAVEGKVVKVTGKEVLVVFENLRKGEYAISVIHDENDNGKLDTNSIGIPKEGFAFGNNAMGMFGPPSFDRSKVKVGDETVLQEIKLKYL